MRGEHLQALIQQRVTGGGITQRAPDHDLEVRGDLVHHPRRQRRLADTAQAQYAHHPAALFEHPPCQLSQFPLAPIKGRDGERIAPILPLPTSRRSNSTVSATSLRYRHWRYGWMRRTLLTQQGGEPGFIEQHLLTSRLPERADLLGLATDEKGLLLHPQGNELFEDPL